MSPTLYLQAQLPLKNTVSDFWQMILMYRCRSIVVLNQFSDDSSVGVAHGSTCKDYAVTCSKDLFSSALLHLAVFASHVIP